MRLSWRTIGLFGFACAFAAAQSTPQVGAVLNAASYTLPGLPGSGIAPGSMFLVFGTGLGPAQLESAVPPLSKKLAETVVHVSGTGFEQDCYLFYTYATQVAGILPSQTPTGSVRLTVTYRGQTSSYVWVPVAGRRPGLLTRNQAGHGAATLQNYNSAVDQPINSPAFPAYPGQAAILWGTGLGAIQADDGIIPPVGNLTDNAQIWLGGKTVKPLYAGRSSQFPAIDQINFVVPDGVEGCHVPLVLYADGVISNYTTMAVAAKGKTCADPTYLAAQDTAVAIQKSQLRVGLVNLGRVRSAVSSSVTGPASADAGAGEFLNRTLNELHAGSGGIDVYSSIGSCYLYPLRAQDRTEWFPFDVMNTNPLDAGQSLTVAGPRGTKTIGLKTKGSFAADLGSQDAAGQGTLFLDPGDYSIDNGGGGSDVGGFRATIRIPSPITWTNQASYASTVSRGVNARIDWSGGDAAHEFVFISGASLDAVSNLMRGFLCTAKADAHSFVIPVSILSYLPQGQSPAGASLATGVLSVGTLPLPETVRFTAPGLDAGYVFYTSQTIQQTQYK
jgi:uncharacterized protein (TIGR03437 family)